MNEQKPEKTYTDGFNDGWILALNSIRMAAVKLASNPPLPVDRQENDPIGSRDASAR